MKPEPNTEFEINHLKLQTRAKIIARAVGMEEGWVRDEELALDEAEAGRRAGPSSHPGAGAQPCPQLLSTPRAWQRESRAYKIIIIIKKKAREQIPDHSRNTDLSTLHPPFPPDQTGTAALDGSKPHSEAPAPQISLTLSRSSLRTSDLFKIVAWQPLDLPKLGRNIPSKRHRPAWPRLCPLPAQGRILIASPAPFQSHVFLFLPLVFFWFFFWLALTEFYEYKNPTRV